MRLDPLKLGNAAPETAFGRNLEKELTRFAEKLLTIINGGILVSENLSVQIVSVTTPGTPGQETAVAHTLKRVPRYIVCNKDKAAHIYDGTSSFTSENIYVRSDVASVTATLLLF